MADNEQYEVVIIGAGPAACAAATFLARAGMRVLMIGNPSQSGLADAVEVNNYPGFPKGIAGPALLAAMQEQATSQGAVFVHGEVTHVEKTAKRFNIKTADTTEFAADNLLLAHGANFIKVHVPGEADLVGAGVHYCALCDGPLYKGKEVVVLGNSNLAAEEALQLAMMGVRVNKIISHALTFNIAPAYQELLTKKNIAQEIGKALHFDAGVRMAIQTQDGTSEVQANGVFVALGVASSAVFAQKLGLEMSGNFLKADEYGRTNVAGVWVAGLARGGVNQIGKSVGEAITAAVDIIKVAKGLPQYLDHT